MYDSIFYKTDSYWIAILIFLLILLTNWMGFRYRKFQEAKPGAEVMDGTGPMESSMLGLMALMLGFTFSMALTKFETRRQIIVGEANNIGTALLRMDLYPDSIKNLLKADFKGYIEARVAYYDADIDNEKIALALSKTNLYSNRIWKRTAGLAKDDRFRNSNLLMVPAVNSMLDIVSVRESDRKAQVPPIILIMLLILTLLSSFLVGYARKEKSRNLVMVCTFCLTTTIALYLILELDRPRKGVLNLNAAEQNITELRKLVK